MCIMIEKKLIHSALTPSYGKLIYKDRKPSLDNLYRNKVPQPRSKINS